ncbi:MAG: histone deacetylase [Clostridia bacterium]
MILHDPRFTKNFRDYGILIPVLHDRATRVLDSVSALPALSGKDWLRSTINEQIDREDLERVHDTDFVASLYDQDSGHDHLPGNNRSQGSSALSGLERELLTAYELLDPQGRPRRYEPETAIRPLSQLFSSILGQVAGTYQAARMALDQGFCFFLGGGMHHARRDGGIGFCLVNDIMVAAARLQAENRAALIWIIDVDAHKGDGTAEIVTALRRSQSKAAVSSTAASDIVSAGRSDTAGSPAPGNGFLTLSIHMADGWPLDAETLATAEAEGRGPDQAPFAASDVELPIKSSEETSYVSRLADGLDRLEALSGGAHPDLAIVVDGADPYEHDGLPSTAGLQLDLETCVQRDLTVFSFLKKRGIPSAWLMAGGYGERAWEPPAAFLRAVIKDF